jgi:DNA-binding NarL/FixJ family response regulator
VTLVVRGASTREISRALYISEYTVQDHLSNSPEAYNFVECDFYAVGE